MRDRNLRVLEFTKIRDMLSSLAISDMGKERIQALTPQRAVTLGQSAVFYKGEECLGGCIVTSVLDAGKAKTNNN